MHKYPFNTPNVLVNGTFNIIHAGHIELFKYAFNLGNLIVGVNTDPYLIQKYGSKVIALNDRINVIQSIRYVSHVLPFEEDNCCEMLMKIKPDFYVKGPDYKGLLIPEIEICKKYQIKYIVMKEDKIMSTSSII
jgi:cytidyltransferase-like protein